MANVLETWGCTCFGAMSCKNGVEAAKVRGMAYDEVLADRIRKLIGSEPDISEQKMFGGLAFLVRGNMAISASGQGGALVRVDPRQSDEFTETGQASVAVMRGRPMPGWLRVDSENLNTEANLARWVEIGKTYARSLPAKP